MASRTTPRCALNVPADIRLQQLKAAATFEGEFSFRATMPVKAWPARGK